MTGVLFIVAAFTHDPETAGGLDAALHTLAGLPFGPVILWIVGAGLVSTASSASLAPATPDVTRGCR